MNYCTCKTCEHIRKSHSAHKHILALLEELKTPAELEHILKLVKEALNDRLRNHPR